MFEQLNVVQLGLLIAAVNAYQPKLKKETLDFEDLSEIRHQLIEAYQKEHKRIQG